MTANQRSGVIASIRRRSRRTTFWSTSAWSKTSMAGASTSMSRPDRRLAARRTARRGSTARSTGPWRTFGKLPFGLLWNPLPGLVRGKECARVLADCSGERDRCHLLPNDTAPCGGTVAVPKRQRHSVLCEM